MIEPVEEKDRFYSRLSMIPGIRPMPSEGSWILLAVRHPTELARRVNRRLSPGIVSVPRHVQGAVRVQVADPKTNELLLRALREAAA
jgi:histidinol-phosphate/aromatic aminotransferase/cobyric acid decarboxylase-like protein